MNGRDLRVGDTVALPTGRVVIQRLYASHGGIEGVVVPVRKKGDKPQRARALWWWPQQRVEIVARSERSAGGIEAIGPRPLSGAALAKKSRQRTADGSDAEPLAGPSSGADREELLAGSLGIPVFRSVEEVLAWLNQ